MNATRAHQRESIDCGPQRLRAACGALCVAAAMSGPSARADDGESPRVQIRPAGVVTAPASVRSATPPPPPLPELRFPVIRPGAAAEPADAGDAHEIRIGPEDGTNRYETPGSSRHALPIISPNGELSPVTLGGPIEIVPQEIRGQQPPHEAGDPAELREPQPAAPPEVQILPAPQESNYIELPHPK